ncbi:hypothetical protein P4U65_25275 [Bacillus pacificus]|nr:hypothetical protein [Bacillus thuringiensis]MED1303801.1 hypothetical protein [Bacillus pacificus]
MKESLYEMAGNLEEEMQNLVQSSSIKCTCDTNCDTFYILCP